MKNKLITQFEDKLIIVSDDDAQNFLKFCLDNGIQDRYITQRDHFFVILNGVPFGGRWESKGVNYNNIDNSIISKQRIAVWYKDFKKSKPNIWYG